MALDGGDAALIATEISATVTGIDEIIPEGSTVLAQVQAVGPRLLSEMQVALRKRWSDLPSPLTDELRELLVTGVIAELLLLGYRNLEEGQETWPDLWRSRFEQGIAALAAGVDSLTGVQPREGLAAGSQTRVFSMEGLGRVLGSG